MTLVTLIAVLLIACTPFVRGQQQADTIPIDFTCQYDFIVVGAGDAGSVVASRLANETNQQILLLEGGDFGTGQRDIGGTDYVNSYFKTDSVTGKQVLDTPLTRYDVPLMADTIRSASDVLNNMWPINPTGPFYSQARVIGGNQATNGLNWVFPTKYDVDQWGIPEYSSANFWPYLQRTENATQTGYLNSPNRGYSGKTNVKTASFVQMDQYRYVNACVAAGYQVGGDVNSGTLTPAVYLNQQNTLNGIRSATAVTYLAPVLRQRKPNLTFRTSATVTRILFNALNIAYGVEYVDTTCNVTKYAFARKEVVMCAGDLQGDKILYNSGIGPKAILTKYGKPLRYVNEIIGQKIRNHQRLPMIFSDPTIDNANFYNYPAASVTYARTGLGPIEGRAQQELTYFSGYPVRAPYPDIQAVYGLLSGGTPGAIYAQGFAITVTLTQNLYANGSLTLTSSNPLAATNFTANTFLLEEDAERIAYGILEVRRVMKYWMGNATEQAPGPQYATIPQLVQYIRANPATTCHYYGSTPMGTDPSMPTDTHMLLRGVTGVRMVGPSVIPNHVTPGMQALANALAEKGVDLIKAQYRL